MWVLDFGVIWQLYWNHVFWLVWHVHACEPIQKDNSGGGRCEVPTTGIHIYIYTLHWKYYDVLLSYKTFSSNYKHKTPQIKLSLEQSWTPNYLKFSWCILHVSEDLLFSINKSIYPTNFIIVEMICFDWYTIKMILIVVQYKD